MLSYPQFPCKLSSSKQRLFLSPLSPGWHCHSSLPVTFIFYPQVFPSFRKGIPNGLGLVQGQCD